MTNPLEFLEIILSLRSHFSFSVTSWLRTPTRNTAVGGHPNSKHLTGLAVDVVLDPGQDKEAFKAEVVARMLTAVDEGDHIHIQVKKTPHDLYGNKV